jgi:hypothetical protein
MVNTKNKNIVFSIINFDHSTKLTYSKSGAVLPVHSKYSTVGYHTPEKFARSEVYLCKADSWALIATIYYFFTHKFVYDYNIITKKYNTKEQKDKAYKRYMAGKYSSNQGTKNIAKLDSKGEKKNYLVWIKIH